MLGAFLMAAGGMSKPSWLAELLVAQIREERGMGGQMREGNGEIGAVDVHLVLTKDRSYFVLGPEPVEALGREEEPDFLVGPPTIPANEFYGKILALLKWLEVNAKLRLYLHSFRTALRWNLSPADLEREGLEGLYGREHRSVCAGTLDVRGSRVFLGSTELTEEAFRRWLEVCSTEFWREPERVTPKRVAELAKLISDHLAAVERKSLETLKRTLGDGVADQLLRAGKVCVRSANGREYVITDSGEVFAVRARDKMSPVCVHVEREGRLPRYDVVLAKYLVIRDHPEQIETRYPRRELEREREILQAQIAELQGRLARLERVRRQGA